MVLKNNEFVKHLESRGLFDAPIPSWSADMETEALSFHFWSPAGTLVGYQSYYWRQPKLRSNEGRYFTWIGSAYRPLGLWGMEYILSRKKEPLIITEGIWDAIRAIGAGYRACAILTATPNPTFKRWFTNITYGQDTVVVKDNDEAGESLTVLGARSVSCPAPYKDLGEMSPDEAFSFLGKVI